MTFTELIAPAFVTVAIFLPPWAQQIVNLRRISLLDTLGEEIKATSGYQQAVSSLSGKNLSKWEFLPVVIIALYVYRYFFYGLTGVTLESYGEYLRTPAIYLSGANISRAFLDSAAEQLAIPVYQSKTIYCSLIAFVACYVFVIRDITISVNMNESSTLTYWFGLVALITSTQLATVIRHLVPYFLPVDCSVAVAPPTCAATESAYLTLAGIGAAMVAYQGLSVIFDLVGGLAGKALGNRTVSLRNSPDSGQLPDAMPLVMIDGMTDQVRSKFNQIGIDCCLRLARFNPLIVWSMTRYSLSQIVDWIAQAILVIYIRPAGRRKVSEFGVRDVFGFLALIEDQNARAVLATKLGWDERFLIGVGATISADADVKQLYRLRKSILTENSVGPKPPEAT